MHQPQAVNELQVEDNVTQFFEPERVRQLVLGYTAPFRARASARESMSIDKAYSAAAAAGSRTRSIRCSSLPEGAADRVRIDAPEARARGVELTLRREAETRPVRAGPAYRYASAEDREGDRWVAPRSLGADGRHCHLVAAGPARMEFSLAGPGTQWHADYRARHRDHATAWRWL